MSNLGVILGLCNKKPSRKTKRKKREKERKDGGKKEEREGREIEKNLDFKTFKNWF